jgi:cell wall-associated NlpC family hydrolase
MRGQETAVAWLVLLAACGGAVDETGAADPSDTADISTASAGMTGSFTMKRLSGPSRTDVYDAQGKRVATFTDGARTVVLKGAARTFREGTAPAVTTSDWVRVLAKPFGGTVDTTWLGKALADTSPDALAIATQYIAGAPAVVSSGITIAGDAGYGPLVGGVRQEGSDFHDYLGVAWTYASGTTAVPDSSQYRDVDCSGFMRLLFGYRLGVPLALSPAADHGAMPRRSFEIYDAAPGVITIADAHRQADPGKLSAGDLVFFDATSDSADQIDHVGMYLGVDALGNHRFISSRKSINGPTFGDTNGKSILEGTGLYATTFRAARRL